MTFLNQLSGLFAQGFTEDGLLHALPFLAEHIQILFTHLHESHALLEMLFQDVIVHPAHVCVVWSIEFRQAPIILDGPISLQQILIHHIILVLVPILIESGDGLDKENVADGAERFDIGLEDILRRRGIVQDGDVYQQIGDRGIKLFRMSQQVHLQVTEGVHVFLALFTLPQGFPHVIHHHQHHLPLFGPLLLAVDDGGGTERKHDGNRRGQQRHQESLPCR